MVVTNYPGNFPVASVVLPKNDKGEYATIILAIFNMTELVFTDRYRPVIFYRINFKAVWNQFSFNAVILIKHFLEVFICLIIVSKTTLVVIKLKVFGKKCFQQFDVMAVKSREQSAILRCDCLV